MRGILVFVFAAVLSACATETETETETRGVAGRTSIAQGEAGLAGAWVVDLSTEPNTPYTSAVSHSN